ncbi:MAG TPA: tetratricopeptide repeat protein [Actinomycetota bacterium]|nr:tetratricopeptide repeat protein [Actinomycetota bacterium]
MSPFAASLVVAALAALAAAGVVGGFLRRDLEPVELEGDPLEDRHLALLRSLSDLEEAHASGALDEPEYRRLREDTDARITRLLRAIDRRERGPASAVIGEEPERNAPVAAAEPRRVPPWAVAVLIGGTIAAMIVAALVRDSGSQTRAASTAPPAEASDPFAFFEERVRQNPDDLAARLDLAHRYLDAGRVTEALDEYAVVLELDPDDAEALAHVGMILYLGERPKEALASVDLALEIDPDYPEALFFRGVILLRGLDRPDEAIDALEHYLEAAPFGIERQTVQDLIVEAQGALAER